MSLGQAQPELALVEGRQRGHSPAGETGRYLRVEDAPGHGAAAVLQRFEVLAGCVGHHQPIAVDEGRETGRVHGQRIHENQIAGPGELYQRHVGPVGALPVELGVQGIPGLGLKGRQYAAQPGFGVYQSMSCHRSQVCGTGQPGAGPASTGLPASIQAPVPPATFTASIPSV